MYSLVNILCVVFFTQQFVLHAAISAAEARQNAFVSHSIEKRDTTSSAIIETDNQQYYQIAVTTSRDKHAFYATEFDRMLDSPKAVNVTELTVNGTWRESLTIQLKFLFYFYGHPVSQIAVTENGHIYITEAGHETSGSQAQYIAPLMAGYDLLLNASAIAYVTTNSSVWVRWTNLALAGIEDLFSFQCAIFKNGSMVFHYHNLPALAERVSGVKAGLADVYNYDTKTKSGPTIRETLVHRAENISIASIVNNSVALVTAVPSCGQLTSCGLCMTAELAPTFNCSWCFQRGQCSSATERRLQAWILQCHYATDASCRISQPDLSYMGQITRGVLAFFLALFLAMIVAFVVTLCVYGHRKPDSPVGQCLMKTRRQLQERLHGLPKLPGVAYRTSNSQVRLQEEA